MFRANEPHAAGPLRRNDWRNPWFGAMRSVRASTPQRRRTLVLRRSRVWVGGRHQQKLGYSQKAPVTKLRPCLVGRGLAVPMLNGDAVLALHSRHACGHAVLD